MAQNINLYQRVRKSNGAVFSSQGVVLITLSLLLGFGLLVLAEGRRTTTLRNQVAHNKAEIERLGRLLKEVPTEDTQSDRLAAEERDIKTLEVVAARLTSGVLGRAGSFTESLKGLGRATHDGVWLTGIKLHQASGRLSLEGKALDAARVPMLIAALSQEPQFAGTAFATLDIKRDEARSDSSVVNFRISSLESQAFSVPGSTPGTKAKSAAPEATPAAASAPALQDRVRSSNHGARP